MGGNGCSCASAPSLPESFATGRTAVVWDLKSLVNGHENLTPLGVEFLTPLPRSDESQPAPSATR